jgi:predicted O-methyltransferase YrrM
MEPLSINGFNYIFKKDEIIQKYHPEYNNLIIYPKVGELERTVGLLNELTENKTDSSIHIYGWNYGGFIPIGCAGTYKDVYIYTSEQQSDITLPTDIPNNIHINIQTSEVPHAIFLSEGYLPSNDTLNNFQATYILSITELYTNIHNYIKFSISRTTHVLYVHMEAINDFKGRFHYYFDETEQHIDYDNLIHLCIMVKNAGPLFEKVLTENLPIIDRWTILDTGSTDGTQDIIRRVLAGKKGTLYEEPFINFRDSRNRCLELAGKNCKYLIMLDDTYVVRNDIREFLNTARGDQFASSYSLLILSNDMEYYSNRVLISERELRYIYTIHEVIQDTNNKTNVVIPKEAAYIYDHRSDYMEKRTMNRKQYDLKLLHEMVRDDPKNPRHYYYLAQTYNLLEDYENAAHWFKQRATTDLSGHDQEAVDSWFEYARILNFKLNRPWDECKKAYEECFKRDNTRPDALYFIGIHEYLEGNKQVAFEYFKNAFKIGYPIHRQFSLKPTLSFHFLPKFLAELCYNYNDWKLGLAASELFLKNNNSTSDSYETMVSWYNIFKQLCQIPTGIHPTPITPTKPLIVFVADGNWSNWTGKDILTKGLGGSETYIVEIARGIQITGQFNCIVFCKCEHTEVCDGVIYMPIQNLSQFIMKNSIHTAIVSRFSEYVPLVTQGFVDNVYLVLHDLSPTGNIIPIHNKLRKVICLTKWHEEYFLQHFPAFKDKTDSFYYGIDNCTFKPGRKIRNSFIYSSFPNRGLLPLLQMWPHIKKALPDATLNIYSDINGKWVNDVSPSQMNEIRHILSTSMLEDVKVHGWVSKAELAEAWSRADIWFYPCIFQETFCLTALEAAATRTLAISAPLAALTETIGDRGILIPGNPMDTEWQDMALKELLDVVRDSERKEELIEKNYKWAIEKTWKARGQEFIDKYLNIEKNIITSQTNDIDYAHMYNWVHDLPIGEGSKQKFTDALAIANPTRILEIGTFAGTSLIEMLKLYPNATGVAIDTWKNYDEDGIIYLKHIEDLHIENIFYNNIKCAGLSNRVVAMKGDSTNMLIELIQRSVVFDFIYVDGSHKCLDCYSDMILAWKLLRKNGVMAVDDILYNASRVAAGDLLSYPLMAKTYFMEKYAGQFRVISDSYRLFIQKL